jgi:hypothetical protein
MQTTIQHTDCEQSTPVWITYLNEYDCDDRNNAEGLSESKGDTIYTPGYYWCVCFPGCLPESDFYGPFRSESAAESDAEATLNY